MAIFFFLVGMEIKHELVDGELSSRERAMLPLFGALGGMLVPAAIYASLHAGGPALSGWGVPMATDIAFAVAALAVFGKRVPPGLKVFLLALAIVDDLGAVSVIAVFYTHGRLARRARLAPAAGSRWCWGCSAPGVRSYRGVLDRRDRDLARHARSPACTRRSRACCSACSRRRAWSTRSRAPSSRPIEQLDAGAASLVGLRRAADLRARERGRRDRCARRSRDPLASRVTLAVTLGLLVGKPLGITLLSWLAVSAGLAVLPPGVGWGAIFGAGILGGIGFTMALFITALAFEDPALAAASKLGVIGASVVAAGLGMVCLARVLPRGA